MNNVMRIIFKEEFKEEGLKKSIISFAVLVFLSLNVTVSCKYVNFNVIVLGVILTSTLYSILYGTSKLKDRRLNLWRVLPIRDKTYFNIIILIIWIKSFILKLLPFIIGIIIKMKTIDEYTIIKLILIGLLSYGTSAVMFYITFFISRKKLNIKGKINFNMKFTLVKSSTLLMKREWLRLFDNKVIWINHFAYIVFVLFFIKNGLTQFPNEAAPYLLLLTCLSSTASISYSLDRDILNFYKVIPISKNKVYKIKFLFNIIISLPMAIGSFIVIKPSFSNEISLGFFIMYMLIISTAIKLYIDYTTPILNWNHVKQIFQNKRKYKVNLINIMVLLPLTITMGNHLLLAILWSIIVLVGIIFLYNKRS